MSELSISQIRKTNPLLNTYKKVIKNWDDEGAFSKSMEENKISSIFGVFYNDILLGASVITIDPNTMTANINSVNGSNTHKEIIDEFISLELPKIAESCGAVEIIFNGNETSQKQYKSLVK